MLVAALTMMHVTGQISEGRRGLGAGRGSHASGPDKDLDGKIHAAYHEVAGDY